MSTFSKEEIITYQKNKWSRGVCHIICDTLSRFDKISDLSRDNFDKLYHLDDLVSKYDLENLKNLKKGDFIEDFV